MRSLLRPMLLIGVVMLVPILPFLAFGKSMDHWIEAWQVNKPSNSTTAAVVVALLSSDIFLPIPSSAVSTFGGSQLGAFAGTASSWIGMNLGAIFGFALARRWGRPFALWFSTDKDLQHMAKLSESFGPALVVLTRAVPVLAEASVLVMGIGSLSWRRFLPPLLLSNLGIALAYSYLGELAQDHQWLPFALGISIALPVLTATIVIRLLPKHAPE